MKPTTAQVIKYLQEHNGENITSDDIAEALGMTKKQVDGAFTMSVQKRDLGSRVPAEITLEDGSKKNVKWLRLNEEGMKFSIEENKAEK